LIAERAGWLTTLYENEFRTLAQEQTIEPVAVARTQRITVNLNVQRGTSMSYECHVDSNPIEGLLYVTTHTPGDGGELAVSRFGRAHSRQEVDMDSCNIYPMAGHLVFLDARDYPHYVRALAAPNAVRVVAAMNYYTPSCPEEARPIDLDGHLFGIL